MTLEHFKNKLKSNVKVEFADTITLIEEYYIFSPTAFKNGELYNEADQNSGSCKLFAFAKLQGFSKEETLACFGAYYNDVLNDPNGNTHQNIRNFIRTGFEGLSFYGKVLTKKEY